MKYHNIGITFLHTSSGNVPHIALILIYLLDVCICSVSRLLISTNIEKTAMNYCTDIYAIQTMYPNDSEDPLTLCL